MNQLYRAKFLSLFSLAILLACGAAAEDTKPGPLKAIEAEQEQLYHERKAIYQSADAPAAWKEWRQLGERISKEEEKAKEDLQPLQRRRAELYKSPAVQSWVEKLTAIDRRLDHLREQQYRLLHDDGESLVRQRHADLAKRVAPQTPQLRKLAFDVLSFPKIDGSTSTQPLAVLIACHAFDMPYRWVGRDERRQDRDGYFWENYGRGEPELKLVQFTLEAHAETLDKRRLATIINRHLATNASTNEAYVNLIEGQSDLGLLARGPSLEELALAKKQGVELEVTPCALDAFVFLVHERNRIRSLRAAQIRDIYSNKLVEWQKAGDYAGRITAYQREENSGSQVLMRSLVMKDTPLFQPTQDRRDKPQLIGYLMSSPFIELNSDPSGIGYSVYYYERFMLGSVATRTLAVDGIEPNSENIQQRRYPFVAEVMLVTRKDLPRDSPAAQLRSWILSPEGQQVVKQSGYVPVGTE